ncbi:cAMP-binding proteins - catabolite gene activator and regulatory subunit of cAMP-dependent protein kinases [hydrothermal vent metagenome]|uniref:cAMP-binding proteins - catabolite gene activator and regulatory subunit of cAMP-dependent protein kinases n=1 Tax=hydrothermal vent metagenome TaxID=652676 RepID=A0A3B0WSY9_9ZZZZ
MSNQVYLFSELKPTDTLTKHNHTRQYPANSILINEGDITSSLYVILEGEVKAYSCDDSGKEVILNILSTGDYFGELSLIDDEPRSASIMTLTQTKVMIISKSNFKQCLSENNDLAFNMIRALTRQVRSLTENVKNLALMDVYGRIVYTLSDLATEKDNEGKMVIKPKLTHQEISQMIGSSREMVSKILKELTNGEYISITKDSIIINKKLPPGW